MSPARRTLEIEPFLAVEVGERAQELERQGVDVVHLEFGEPDFEAPPVVRDALEKAIKDGRTKYVSSLGILPLREAIAAHYWTTYRVRVSPEQILVTPGTSPAMLLLFGHLLDPGDEVVLSDPYYACYPNFIRYPGGLPAYVSIREDEGFQLEPEAVTARLGARTRAVLLNSPANPTGAVLSADRLAGIARLAADGGPVIVSDEIYHGLSYGGRDRSILEFTERAFVLNGFSKAFAMTGWRLGYLIAPRDHIRALQTAFGNFFISTNEFVQWAGIAALAEASEEPARFRAIFDERRRAMIAGLREIGLGVGFEPTGAFYVLANARRFTTDSVRFAYEILDEAHVALTPGAAFGANAEGYLRFSYAASLERIQEGLRRIGRFLATRS
ncbi:MAG: pyridoxal phosphate-dependent aminotransferase [Candidatus Rokubacteria bacterium]|nr:pyridoxal phosphate-dependent aminotransferase [Candidatus Rokubacteria bacterium]MBI3827191.1 pyridoxal phosphate-dependent aminotransferase [Candidatus Rokubacteria bacterium]